MFSPHIDLGQVILAGLISIIGWFIRRELTSLTSRLDKHDGILIKMVENIGELKGIVFQKRF